MDRNIVLKYTKNIGTYFSASLIPMILNLISNPFIAMNMDPEDYAIVGYYTSFNTLIQPLITFYMIHYYTKRFYELDELERKELRATLMKSLIWFSGFLSIICLGGVVVYTVFLNKETTMPLFPYVIMTVMPLPLTGVMSLMTCDFRMERKANDFFKLSVSNGLLLVFLNFLFVVIIKWGAFGKMLAPLLTNALFFFYCLYRYRDLFQIPFNKDIFKQMFLFCWPLTIAAMLSFFSNGYDRVFLERLGDAKELGYYCVGLQIATYVNVFQTAINSTFQPDIYQCISERNWKRLFKVISFQVSGLLVVVLGFVFFAPFVIKILTAGRYMMSVGYTRILVLSSITGMIYYCLSQVTIAIGYTQITLINKIISSILIIGMFGLLIPKYHYYGAAWGQVLSFVIFFVGNAILLFFFIKLNKRKSDAKNI